MIKEDQGCPLWESHDELTRDAREEIEIEFGLPALGCLTLQKQRTQTKKKNKGVVRNVRRYR